MKVWIETHSHISGKGKLEDDGFTSWEAESQKQIDWNNRSDRKWLESHMHWALNNTRKVTVEPVV